MELLDGGFLHNCPVQVAYRESQLLWRDGGEARPDIFLSLGTGYNPEPRVTRPSFRRQRQPYRNIFTEARGVAEAYARAIRDCRHTWASFVDGMERAHPRGLFRESPEFRSRYIRLDLALNEGLPEIDETGKVGELEGLVRGQIPEAKEVAHRLIASCFYFKPGRAECKKPGPGYQICGKLSS